MGANVVEKSIDYTCVHCRRKTVGRYVAGGWWQYPFGWLVHDDGVRWACSVQCAHAQSSPAP
jgi:hypothetical protein